MVKFYHPLSIQNLPLLLALLFVISAGCWNQVEYEPREKPSTEQSAVPPLQEQETSTPTDERNPAIEENPAVEATEVSPAAESFETPDQTATPEGKPSSTEAVAPPNEEEKLTYDDLFGEPVAPPAEVPAEAEAPPLAESEATPSTEISPPASEPADRYAATPTPDPPAAPPSPSSVDDRYATTPEPLTPTEPAEELPSFLRDTPSPPASESATPDRYADSTPAAPEPMTPTESSAPPFGETPPAAEAPTVPTPSLPESTPVAKESSQPTEETPIASPAPSPEVSFDEHPAATPTSAPTPTNTRLQAWLLGSKWSLMLLKEHTVGLQSEDSELSKDCEKLAEVLKVKLPQSQFASASKPTAAFLENLVFAARELGSSIGKEDGATEMALFEVAVKSNLLLVAAEPRNDLVPIIERSVSAAAKRAELPEELMQQFSNSLAKTPKPGQFDGAVQEFHRDVESHLRSLP